MVSRFLILVALNLPLAAEETKEDKAKTDQENLQGHWEITSDGYYGSQRETNGTRRLMIEGETFTFEEDGRVLSRGTFKLKPSQSPKAIDIEITEGRVASRGSKYLGIYKLDGDTLAWCWAGLGSTDRPKDFIFHADYPRQNVLIFKRARP
jgi:uncharacterized protein (TIGR03067 family)